ncbi:MAG: dockerin type I repeat-containing protein, partial [Clostridia bacterium]|nr:dockerin type I repeat-containing protein [Clostridia bacterium]
DGVGNVGGIIGWDGDTQVEISDCSNCGSVQANDMAGGIVGYMYINRSVDSVELTSCYNVGTVEGGTAHTLIGAHDEYAEPDTVSCYYLDNCCEAGDEYAEALTDEQLRLAGSYEGFDFEGIWTMEGDPEYPYAELIGQYVEPAPVIPGDVDGSGTVNVSDAIMALRASMGLLELTNEQFTAADMDGSNTVTVSDAIMILRTAMGLV